MTEPNKKIKLEYIPEELIKNVLQNIQNSSQTDDVTDQIAIKREIILAEPDFLKKSSSALRLRPLTILNEKSNGSSGSTNSDEIGNLSNSVMTSSIELSRTVSDEFKSLNPIKKTNIPLIQPQTEEERNKDKRERNKLAARRCRKRKMDKINELKTAVREMGNYFEQIKSAVQNKEANNINLAKLDDLIHLSNAVVESDTVDGTKYILSCIQAGAPVLNPNQSTHNSRRNSAISNANNAATVGQISPELTKSQYLNPQENQLESKKLTENSPSKNSVKIIKLLGNLSNLQTSKNQENSQFFQFHSLPIVTASGLSRFVKKNSQSIP